MNHFGGPMLASAAAIACLRARWRQRRRRP